MTQTLAYKRPSALYRHEVMPTYGTAIYLFFSPRPGCHYGGRGHWWREIVGTKPTMADQYDCFLSIPNYLEREGKLAATDHTPALILFEQVGEWNPRNNKN